MKRHQGIVMKIAAATCGIVSLLLLVGGGILVNFEIRQVNSFQAERVATLNQSFAERQNVETASLEQHVRFNAQLLSEISAKSLYEVEPESLDQMLHFYLSYPDIEAAVILDETGKPFAAAWKAPEITVGSALPGTIQVDPTRAIQVEVSYKAQRVGAVTIYYTNAALTTRIQRAKDQMLAQANAFDRTAHDRLRGVIISQSIGVVLIIIALVSSLMVLLRNMVLKPLHEILQVMLKVANFDLTVTLCSVRNDEVGQLCAAINKMVTALKNVLGQAQHSGIQVTSSSTELSATTKQQETTLNVQMDSTNNVVKAVQEISEVAAELAATMQQVAAMLQETAEFASHGQTDLTHMQSAMARMEDASQSISGRLQTINEKAENITNVVTTITKVADQTNLLSLNAAIEAEKAGEYGRGFTVVAREIRRLADQTAVATLDIEQMVQGMQSAVTSGVMEMDKFMAEVRHSAKDVEQISAQLSRIIEQVQELSPRFESVNHAMEQQSGNAQKISTAMFHVEEEMQQTRESLHETFGAIAQLNEAAQGLQEQVSLFKVE